MIFSGCQALHGCERKSECLRYQHFMIHPLVGFHAHQSCKISEFTEKRYPFFVQSRTQGSVVCED